MAPRARQNQRNLHREIYVQHLEIHELDLDDVVGRSRGLKDHRSSGNFVLFHDEDNFRWVGDLWSLRVAFNLLAVYVWRRCYTVLDELAARFEG